MKNGKRPTVAQKKEMKRWGLNEENWLVVKNEPTQMIIVHRLSGQQRRIPREE